MFQIQISASIWAVALVTANSAFVLGKAADRRVLPPRHVDCLSPWHYPVQIYLRGSPNQPVGFTNAVTRTWSFTGFPYKHTETQMCLFKHTTKLEITKPWMKLRFFMVVDTDFNSTRTTSQQDQYWRNSIQLLIIQSAACSVSLPY